MKKVEKSSSAGTEADNSTSADSLPSTSLVQNGFDLKGNYLLTIKI